MRGAAAALAPDDGHEEAVSKQPEPDFVELLPYPDEMAKKQSTFIFVQAHSHLGSARIVCPGISFSQCLTAAACLFWRNFFR